MPDVPIKCRCGSVMGVLHNAGKGHGNRCVCYCDDCQAFAHYLGRGDEILDANGGTDVYQVSPGRLEFLSGKEHLACVHLTDQPTLRWYADCCKTPIGNTLASNKLPFIGLVHSCIDASGHDDGLDGLIGLVRVRVRGKYARGDLSGLDVHDAVPLSLYLRLGAMMLWWKLSGAARQSPLFDRETGRPIVEPIRLRRD